ncbi:MAG: histidinol dehydrogenase [Micrococcales bacterium]
MGNRIRTVDLRGQNLSAAQVRDLIPRASLDIAQAMEQIRPLVGQVKAEGLAAIVAAAQKFDGFNPEPVLVSKAEIDVAVAGLDSKLRVSIEESIERVRKVSQATLPKSTSVQLADGAEVSQRWQAIESVGLYVPGGRAVYPSSVIMNVVPAQVAGVSRLVIATPGQKDFGGRPHPTVLATAGLLGVENVLNIGGPAAIAAFAYGLPEINFDSVDLVTGPGNIFVAAAKRLLRGTIGIDSEAGTTEILILADSTANPRLIAYDLVSQAEHDDAAASVLVTDSVKLIDEVISELEKIVPATHHSERVAKALSGQQSALVIVDHIAQGIEVANAYATEHLEIMTSDAQSTLKSIKHAGAIFLGDYSPVSLGDYMAGSNHVLPTGSTARFNAGLGVSTFLRAQQIINYDSTALAAIAEQIDAFAKAEGLPAHGQAVTARFTN